MDEPKSKKPDQGGTGSRRPSRRDALAAIGSGAAGAVLAGLARAQKPAEAEKATTPGPAAKTTIAGKYDVVVAGGGIAGVAAATAAARAGARVALVEMQPFAGGVTTASLESSMCNYFHNTQGERIVAGRPLELVERMVQLGAAHKNWDKHRGHVVFDSELGKLAMDEMLEAAGVDRLYNYLVTDAVMEGNRLVGLHVASRSGNQVMRAECVVDCTGDGDVAHYAGAPLHRGPRHASVHSYLFRLGNVDLDATYRYFRENPAEYVAGTDINLSFEEGMAFYEDTGVMYIHHHGTKLKKAVQEPIERGEYSRELGPFKKLDAFQMHGIRHNRTLVVNTGWFVMPEPDAAALSAIVVAGRKMARYVAEFLRKHLPGCEESFVVTTANAPGIRRTRWLAADFTLTRAIYDTAPRFPDAVGRGVKIQQRPLYRTDETFDVPLRCLLPREIDGLLVGSGRSASCVPAELLRVQPATMIVGQGAGAAAAVSVRDGVPPRNVDVRAVQEALRAQGVDLI